MQPWLPSTLGGNVCTCYIEQAAGMEVRCSFLSPTLATQMESTFVLDTIFHRITNFNVGFSMSKPHLTIGISGEAQMLVQVPVLLRILESSDRSLQQELLATYLIPESVRRRSSLDLRVRLALAATMEI